MNECCNGETEYGNGNAEAIAIDERHDEQMLLDVTERECGGGRTRNVIDECQREILTQSSDIAATA